MAIQNDRTWACDQKNCKYGRDKCKNAHSLTEWIVPVPLRCSYGNDCHKKICQRAHNPSMEEKIVVMKYKNITFLEQPLMAPPVRRASPPPPVRMASPPPPMNMEQEQMKQLLKMKVELKIAYDKQIQEMEVLKGKMCEYKQLALNFWEVGSPELEF